MLRLAVVSLLAFELGTNLHLPAADAAVISRADPYVSQFCTGCAPLKDDDLQIYRGHPLNKEITTPETEACEDHSAFDCVNRTDDPTGEETEPAVSYIPEIILSNDHHESETFELRIPARDWGDYQRTLGCSYFDSELHDPRRVQDECGNVEPGSDYSELISVLTLTTGLVLCFAVIALAWLGRRSYRNWRLRNMVSQGPTANPRSSLQARRR
jgi:hypothetical protein